MTTVVASASTSSTVAAPSASTAPTNPFAHIGWRDLVAAEAWSEARDAIDALDATTRARTEVKLARARVGVGLCSDVEGAAAIASLDELLTDGASITTIEPLLRSMRVDALVCAGKWAEALPELRKRTGVVANRTLARAFAATGEMKKARASVDDAIAAAAEAKGRSPVDGGALLRDRLRLDRALSDASAIEADRRALFLDHPSAFEAAVASGEPATPPTLDREQWLRRADTLAANGRADDSLAAVDAAVALGLEAKAAERKKANLLFLAKAYARAAIALDEVAAHESGQDAIADAFHAARARSRANDDAPAMQAYETLASLYPSDRWGAQASFLGARLRFSEATRVRSPEAFTRAIASLDTFIAGPSGRYDGEASNVADARRDRIVALLEGGHAADAVVAIDRLAAGKGLDSLSRGRLELMAAIAAERSGDVARSIMLLETVRAAHPLSYLDLAASMRLRRLGTAVPPAYAGPIEADPWRPDPASSGAPLLWSAGLRRDLIAALHVGAQPLDLRTRCARWVGSDDAASAYSGSLALDAASTLTSASWQLRCTDPTPWRALTDALEASHHLPSGLLDATFRQESAFRVEAVSPAGAFGVAQLMPATAAMTARATGLSLDVEDPAALMAPATQLRLAAAHLASLYVDFAGPAVVDDPKLRDRFTPLVIAAYNAGEPAVRKWMIDAGSLDADLFIERIPFGETRIYVARVLTNLVRYAIVLGADPPTLASRFQ